MTGSIISPIERLLLMELGRIHAQWCGELVPARPLLEAVSSGDVGQVVRALTEEENRERAADRIYWQPLKQELERLRHAAIPGQKPPC